MKAEEKENRGQELNFYSVLSKQWPSAEAERDMAGLGLNNKNRDIKIIGNSEHNGGILSGNKI